MIQENYICFVSFIKKQGQKSKHCTYKVGSWRETRLNRQNTWGWIRNSISHMDLYSYFNLLCCSDGEGNGNPLQYSGLENPMDGGAWWASVHGVTKVGHNWATSLSLFTFMHWRTKWQPTPCSCLENPRDGGAWWAAICGVAQSRTWMKRLSSSGSSLAIAFYQGASVFYFHGYSHHLQRFWSPRK